MWSGGCLIFLGVCMWDGQNNTLPLCMCAAEAKQLLQDTATQQGDHMTPELLAAMGTSSRGCVACMSAQ